MSQSEAVPLMSPESEEVKGNETPTPVPAAPPLNEEPEATPKASPVTVTPEFDVKSMDMRTYIRHVAMWNDPKLSSKALFFLVVEFYYIAIKGYSFAAFVCLAALYRILVVFALNQGAKICKAKENGLVKRLGGGLERMSDAIVGFIHIPEKESISFWTENIGAYMEQKLTNATSAFKKAETDVGMVKVVTAHLVAFFTLFLLFDVQTIIFAGAFFLLIVPAVYIKNNDKIDPLLEQAKEKMKPYVDMLEAKGREFMEQAVNKADDLYKQAVDKMSNVQNPQAGAEESKKDN